jgi:3-deoxy-manno-octulosonate cytidylyltransferase (CMP-KDO synthetase)
MKTAIVIPARFGSQRLPGKPLLRATGKYLIEHVYERAVQARRASQVIVATDDERIASAVESFGGQVQLTRADHPSGSDRVAEIAARLDADVIVNLQGDEPLVEVEALDLLPHLLEKDSGCAIATLATPIRSWGYWQNPNVVKVVCDDLGRALYFSRSPIPYVRDNAPDFEADPPCCLQHLGLYAYRRDALVKLAQTPPSPLELMEKLEQLRALALGMRIAVGVVPHAGFGIDTYSDYDRFVQNYMHARPEQIAA